ncbi:MAG: aldo/keto reductase [Bacteroidales bacterium]|nr:aldo/keto reductase [Bacteroidales bacterium]
MNYNVLGRTGLLVSEIGLGCEYLEDHDYQVIKETIDAAIDGGINIFDVFMSEPNVRSNIGKALKGRRERVYIQGHFRSIWKDGQYTRTLNLDEVVFFFEDLLKRLDTDYIDFGMLHMLDNEEDANAVFNGEILKYALSLKERGIIKNLGISSHVPAIAIKLVKTGLIDVILFNINPVYDMLQGDVLRPRKLDSSFFETQNGISGINDMRMELYKLCASMNVGMTAMKILGAGVLLNKRTSPFGVAMTVPQCIHYALSKPAVASVLIGMQSAKEIAEALQYETMKEREKDFSFILKLDPKYNNRGQCVYCNHCLPCPSHINIAHVNKCIDLVDTEDTIPKMVLERYRSFKVKADSCVACGACEKRCPFNVKIMERMNKAKTLFEK